MRCKSCSKFDGQEVGYPEVEGEIEGTLYSGTIAFVLNCAECGDELARADTFVSCDFAGEFEDPEKPCPGDPDDPDAPNDGIHAWKIDEETAENGVDEGIEVRKFTNRKGQKRTRKVATFSTSASVSVRCEKCGKTHAFEITGEVSRDEFEENN